MYQLNRVIRNITSKKRGNDKHEISYTYILGSDELVSRKSFIELQLEQLNKDMEIISLRKTELEEELTMIESLINGQ